MRFCALLLLAVALRGMACAPPRSVDLLDPLRGPPTVVPDLEHDGVVRLSWLPGIGVGRAREVVRARPFLVGALVPERLAELPGIGVKTQAEVCAWYAAFAKGSAGARLEWIDDDRGGGP